MKTLEKIIVTALMGIAAISSAAGETDEKEPGIWYNSKKKVVALYRDEAEYVNIFCKRFATKEQLDSETMNGGIGKLSIGDEKRDGTMYLIMNATKERIPNIKHYLQHPEDFDTYENEDTHMYHTLKDALGSEEFKKTAKKTGVKNTYVVEVFLLNKDMVAVYNNKGEKVADTTSRGCKGLVPDWQ